MSTWPQGTGRVVVSVRLFSLLLASVAFVAPAWALDRTWIGGNVDWVDAGANTNWNPNDEPDSDDRALFNTANVVNLGSNNAVNGLALSGGIDLLTNEFDLTVDGLVEVAGVSTNLIINGGAGSINADDVTINADGVIELRGGTLTMDEEVGTAVIDLNVDGTLMGNGTISFSDTPIIVTSVLINDGVLTALSRGVTLFSPPPVGTLQINNANANARVDLDGTGEAGVVNINRNQTLDLNAAFADAFNGTMNLFQESTFNSFNGWILAGGSLNANNGFVDGGIFGDTPAGVSTIAGGLLSQIGGTINVVDTDGTLQFDAPFTMTGGTLENNGLVVFNSSTTIGNAANMTMPTTSSSLRVEGGHTVTINQANFNMDGANAATNAITVSVDSTLNINTGDYDTDSVTNAFDGTITLNDGEINVTTGDAEFVMDGVLNMISNGVSLSFAEWSGEPLDIGNDSGVLDAKVNVSGTHFSRISAPVDFNSDADVHLDGVALLLESTVNFDTVNGVNNAEFTGDGFLRFGGVVNVNEAVTINMVGGVVDLDGSDFVGDFVNIDAPMTINAATMENFGKVNGGGGTNTIDINNSVGTGVLTVNLDDSNHEWTLNGPGVMNLVNGNTAQTLLAGSDVNINGTLNVTGDVRTTARLDIVGTVNINTGGEPLRLAGGDNSSKPNTIAGGTINGPGILGADANRNLFGFGTISADIDFDGFADLLAEDGMLTVNGAILDVGLIGARGETAILNVTNPWSSSGAVTVVNQGGEIRGGTIFVDNPNGIVGQGLVSARVINNTRLMASGFFVNPPARTHVYETVANNNDWDGVGGTGILEARDNQTLELRDDAPFGFTGTVIVEEGSRVFTNGFALDFNAGSALNLTDGIYESSNSTNIGGTITVNAGPASTIIVENNSFLVFENGSSTTLNANLRLENNNIIVDAGATFSGTGALIIPDGSHMVADNLADIGVLLEMNGAFRPGNSEGIGRVDLFDYQQGNTGELFIEITGTSLNAFDRLVADGDVIVDGYLNIDLDGGFLPTLGQTFNIITGNSVTGSFDYADVSSDMPDDLAFHIEYLANAVQLQVVPKPFFSADFDEDGDVDATDLAIWQGAYNLNQLGDADGDNDSDGRDFLLWQQQFGSAPLTAITAHGTAVPEPGGLVLLGMVLLAVSSSRFTGSPE